MSKTLVVFALLSSFLPTILAVEIDVFGFEHATADTPRRIFYSYESVLKYPVGTRFTDAELLYIARTAYTKMIAKHATTFPNKNAPSCMAAIAVGSTVFLAAVVMGGGRPPPAAQPPPFAYTWPLGDAAGLWTALNSCYEEESATKPGMPPRHRTGVCAELHATNMVFKAAPNIKGKKFPAEWSAKVAVWCSWGVGMPCAKYSSEYGCNDFTNWANITPVSTSVTPVSPGPPDSCDRGPGF